jgi:hypothetical protein
MLLRNYMRVDRPFSAGPKICGEIPVAWYVFQAIIKRLCGASEGVEQTCESGKE